MKFILILALINIYCLTSTASEKTNKKRKRGNYSLPRNTKKFSKQCPHEAASEDEDDSESNILKLILSKALIEEDNQQENTTDDFIYEGEESILEHPNIKKNDFDTHSLDNKTIKTKTYVKYNTYFQKKIHNYQKYIAQFKEKAKTIPFIIYGPKGCGKSTLVREIAISERAYLYDIDIKNIKQPKIFLRQGFLAALS